MTWTWRDKRLDHNKVAGLAESYTKLSLVKLAVCLFQGYILEHRRTIGAHTFCDYQLHFMSSDLRKSYLARITIEIQCHAHDPIPAPDPSPALQSNQIIHERGNLPIHTHFHPPPSSVLTVLAQSHYHAHEKDH